MYKRLAKSKPKMGDLGKNRRTSGLKALKGDLGKKYGI